jgi:hypothetical protein
VATPTGLWHYQDNPAINPEIFLPLSKKLRELEEL